MSQDGQITQQTGGLQEVWEWVRALLVAVLLFFLIRTFLFAPFIVDGESIAPTLQDGERLIVTKAVYLWGEPKRGDIVVFHASETRDYIKRVIGVLGDTIAFRDDALYINDQQVDEPYLAEVKATAHAAGQTMTEDLAEVQIEEGHYFVMGDNRRNSQDSRMIGPVSEEKIIGRADVVFWPFSSFRLIAHEQLEE